MLTLIIGAAASGKSEFVRECASYFPECHYFGTASRFEGDDSLQEKINELKEKRPAQITTFESPLSLENFLVQSRGISCVVVDCLNLWVGSLLTEKFAQYSRSQIEKHCQTEFNHFLGLVEKLTQSGTHVFLVTSELGAGINPSHESGRIFRQLLGQFNQTVATKSQLVCMLTAGIPLLIKEPSHETIIHITTSQKLFDKMMSC